MSYLRIVRATAGMLLVAICPIFAAGQQEKNVAPPKADAAHYLGADTCKTCHEDLYKKNFENTPHFKTTLDSGHGCESCHGPGSAHVDGGGDVTKIIRFSTLSKQEA
ncbi:MAG TPA: hypothetical protein VH437_12965, partial [Terriglobales bacterium]